ncbi:MAG: flagellar hook-length control protein FliK, partial [Oleibacter sp.]|nr:flagellar hook-length control protein FliK [Thalassolituus sp.]
GAGLAALDNSRGNIKGLLLALVQSLPNSALGNGSHKALLNSLSPALASLGSASFTASPSNSMADQVGDILRQAQTILARVENEQVRFISTNDPQLLSIPLLWKNEQGVQQSQLEMQSSKEGSKNSAGQRQSRWQLTLRFDLPYLGELDIELDLKPPSVAATFWSEEAATRARLNETLAPLRSQLQDLGAEVRELKVRHGRCPANTTTIRHSLVDVHT